MNKIYIIFLLSFFVNCNVFADNKIAVIDIKKIMDHSNVGKSVLDQLNKKRSEFQSDMEKKEGELSKLYQELNKQKSILAPDALETKTKNFNDKVAIMQRDSQAWDNVIEQAYLESVKKIESFLRDIVKDISKEKNISIVLQSDSAFSYEKDLDITEESLNKLNKKIQKIDLKFSSIKTGK